MKAKDYLVEMFGEPIGMLTGEPAVGVRDERTTCASCGMMPMDLEADGCGCGYQEEPAEMCQGCGIPVDQCGCEMSNVCPACGMMSLEPGAGCNCVMSEAKKKKKNNNSLWANIHAKRKRGEKPAKPGDPDRPDPKAWKKLTKSR